MRRFHLVSVLASLACFLTFQVGCGSKSTDQNSNGFVVGDTTDEDFQSVEGALELTEGFSDIMLDAIYDHLGDIWESPDFPEEAPSTDFRVMNFTASADSFSFAYHSESDYWHFYANIDDSTEGVTITLIDSVQFRHGATPVQWPDSALLDGLAQGANLSIVPFEGPGMVYGSQDVTVTGEIASQGDITINGTQNFAFGVSDEVSQCDIDLDLTMVSTNVQVNVLAANEGDCPSSGIIAQTGTVGIECTGQQTLSISDNWTITHTFQGDNTVHIVVQNSTTRWETTESCSESISASSPFRRLEQAMQR